MPLPSRPYLTTIDASRSKYKYNYLVVIYFQQGDNPIRFISIELFL